jgi:SAM-dependent methyltransferase
VATPREDRSEIGERAQSLRNWEEAASGWVRRSEEVREFAAPLTHWLIDAINPQPAERVLELAAGLGETGLLVAELVAPAGGVIVSDQAEAMLAGAREHAAALGLSNVEFSVLNAEWIDLPVASVDAVVCRWGYMLMADPLAALSETRRVLRDGGPLCFAVWRTPDLNPWAAVPAITLVQRGHMEPPQPGAPGMFAMGERDRTLELVRGAGFGEPEIEEIDFAFRYSSFDDLWESLVKLAGPLARAIEALPADEREATREAIKGNLAQFANEDGSYSSPASSWGVCAR